MTMFQKHLLTSILVVGAMIVGYISKAPEHGLLAGIAANLWWVWKD